MCVLCVTDKQQLVNLARASMMPGVSILTLTTMAHTTTTSVVVLWTTVEETAKLVSTDRFAQGFVDQGFRVTGYLAWRGVSSWGSGISSHSGI